MEKEKYISAFEELAFGLFVHFGLYSKIGKGEWYLKLNPYADQEKYEALTRSFKVQKNWAKRLVKTAKAAGCKYITLTARHHDGFSLYDTRGLNTYDAPHSVCERDLIAEFVAACREEGIVPFFYHTLLDWHEPAYQNNFPAYIDYLVNSIEILCRNYGKIGGFWFDGMWDKPNEDWHEDRLYGVIRKYLPEAMIINNTGLSAQGKTGHHEIDSVTFERGKPRFVDYSDKYRAGEMCQILNDHWGYCAEDCNYKSVRELIEDLVDCRGYGCNFLLNTGLRGNGSVNAIDGCLLAELGKWIEKQGVFLYSARPAFENAEGALLLKGNDGEYYAVVKEVPVGGDENVSERLRLKRVTLDLPEIGSAVWLDNGEQITITNGSFSVEPFPYGTSYAVRVAKIKLA